MSPPVARFFRIDTNPRPFVSIYVDGRRISALEGDTVLTALITTLGVVRGGEFGEGPRAGFCCIGLCQDCWVTTRDGVRFRACTTPVVSDMDILTGLPADE